MKRFFVLAALVGMLLPFTVGCEKKAETKPAAPAETPAAPADAPADAPK